MIDKEALLKELKGNFKKLGFKLEESKGELFCEDVLSKGNYLTLEISSGLYDKPYQFTLFINEKDFCVSDVVTWQSATNPIIAILGFYSQALSLYNYYIQLTYEGGDSECLK